MKDYKKVIVAHDSFDLFTKNPVVFRNVSLRLHMRFSMYKLYQYNLFSYKEETVGKSGLIEIMGDK